LHDHCAGADDERFPPHREPEQIAQPSVGASLGAPVDASADVPLGRQTFRFCEPPPLERQEN
jgi:hypothetical protein